MQAIRDHNSRRPRRKSYLMSKPKSSSDPIKSDTSLWCSHVVGSLNAPSRGSTAAEGSPKIGRTSTEQRWRSCASLPFASCCEGFVIPYNVSGRTLKASSRGSRSMTFTKGARASAIRPLRCLVRRKPGSLPLVAFTSPCAARARFACQPSTQPTARKMITRKPATAVMMPLASRDLPRFGLPSSSWPLSSDTLARLAWAPAETPRMIGDPVAPGAAAGWGGGRGASARWQDGLSVPQSPNPRESSRR
jgi:hypothetical protein